VTYYKDPEKLAEVSMDLMDAMKGLDIASIPENERLSQRGW